MSVAGAMQAGAPGGETPGQELDRQLRRQLEVLQARQLHRLRRIVDGAHGVRIRVDGRDCLNFCGNDYLGLAADPRLAEAATAALRRDGTGSGASALVSGYNREHARLEEALADFCGRPRALLFSSGWAANLGVLRALLGRGDVLLADDLNHASLIDGGRLSGAAYQRFPHRNLPAAAELLRTTRADGADRRLLLATDAVFSMDGDRADLSALARQCADHRGILLCDDAHGFGIVGPGGRGSAQAAGIGAGELPIYVATLGKAVGTAGAFVAGSETLIDYLVQRARTWVFSTAPPPALAAASLRALQIIASEPERRAQLEANVNRLRDGLRNLGIAAPPGIGPAEGPIQPLLLGSEARALAASRALAERGFWVAAIRPPTVPTGTSRLRITVSAAHRLEQIDALVEALQDILPALAADHSEAADG